jgi:hypothetical protein
MPGSRDLSAAAPPRAASRAAPSIEALEPMRNERREKPSDSFTASLRDTREASVSRALTGDANPDRCRTGKGTLRSGGFERAPRSAPRNVWLYREALGLTVELRREEATRR